VQSCCPLSPGQFLPGSEHHAEYEVGHSTVTFILDKQLRKRVAYSGINWDVDDFLHDLKALADE